LNERYGQTFTVSHKEGYFVISLEGTDKSVRIGPLIPSFYDMSRDLSCGMWESEKEGYPWAKSLTKMPTPGMGVVNYPLVQRENETFTVDYDLLGFAFWMMCRVEEIDTKELDAFDRFSHLSSHAFKHNYLERPLVDEWFELLRLVINDCWRGVPLKQPEFKMEVSHDVDRPRRIGPHKWSFLAVLKSVRTIAVDLLVRRDPSVLTRRIFVLNPTEIETTDPYNTFDWIMTQSESKGLVSTFYFLSGMTNFSKDSGYSIEHRAIRRLIRRIKKRGHRVGLHPSFNSFRQPDQIKKETARLLSVLHDEGLEAESIGARMHYLRWEQPLTMELLESSGLKHDASMTYAEKPGFRCGTCFDYIAYNPVSHKMLGLRIKPLIAMEASIIDYHKISKQQAEIAQKELLLLKGACRSVGGTFSLLWHNSELIREEHREIYKAVLVG